MEPVRYKKPMKIELFIENRELKKQLKEERELNKKLLEIIKKQVPSNFKREIKK